jgi:hypothetical protein
MWFIDDGSTKGLSYLSFWLNSVVLNTRRADGSAPILLVGTHKDLISDSDAHQRISSILSDTFGRSTAWQSIIHYDRGRLLFFPVDNTIGEEDEVVRDLREAIKAVLVTDAHLKTEVPFTWYHALDILQRFKEANEKSSPSKQLLRYSSAAASIIVR